MRYEQISENAFKGKIQVYLEQILGDASLILKTLHEKDQCLLCELDDLGHVFQDMQGIASSFYLQSYIEEFTPAFIELAKAIKALSEHKHGALIVIERADPVERFIQKGTSLHAEISSSLIESIFFPGNPLHDGALLVRENKLVSASNVLPLTTKEVDIHLGTRHLRLLVCRAIRMHWCSWFQRKQGRCRLPKTVYYIR
nr:YojJ [Bacillus subtilis subsp. subtilis str. 168]